jgi:hypothetical protein
LVSCLPHSLIMEPKVTGHFKTLVWLSSAYMASQKI